MAPPPPSTTSLCRCDSCPRGEQQTYSSSIRHKAKACAVERLRPFTSYKLSLKATNDIRDSDFSAEMDEVTMLQDAPGHE
ncbi:protein sidekick-1-like isoform X2 [Ursus americanus]|uniref:protein sidekick-1-like isoform X2 n=1 Tax=Ursus americanus TaxID=9643 RepID=UPI001E67D350|nr:protein sidekick-1-like isoform X2 [Ursus americanus]